MSAQTGAETPQGQAGGGLGRAGEAVWRTGDFLADAILLLVVMGVAAEWMWALGWDSDAVGFAWLGGGFGYLMAYFAFVLFGLMAVSARGGGRCLAFWRGLHPFNLGLAGVAAAAAWTSHFPAQFIAVAAGAGAALFWGEKMLAHPRKLTAICLAAIFLSRAFVSWRWLTPLGAGGGAFLILLTAKCWAKGVKEAKSESELHPAP